jgi:hypothetical protein
MSNPNHDQIWKSFVAQDLTRLSGQIARSDDPSAHAFACSDRRNQRASTIVLRSDKWRESFQSFVHTPDACWIRICIEEPVLPALGSGSPKQADG